MTFSIVLTGTGSFRGFDRKHPLPDGMTLICFGPRGTELSEKAIAQLHQIITPWLNDKTLTQHQVIAKIQSLWLIPSPESTPVKELYHPRVYTKKAPDLILNPRGTPTVRDGESKKTLFLHKLRRKGAYLTIPAIIEQLGRRTTAPQTLVLWFASQVRKENTCTPEIEQVVTHQQFLNDYQAFIESIEFDYTKPNLSTRTPSQFDQLLEKYSHAENFINFIPEGYEATALDIAQRCDSTIKHCLLLNSAKMFRELRPNVIAEAARSYSAIRTKLLKTSRDLDKEEKVEESIVYISDLDGSFDSADENTDDDTSGIVSASGSEESPHLLGANPHTLMPPTRENVKETLRTSGASCDEDIGGLAMPCSLL